MKYEFPHIENIREVEQAIGDAPEFFIADRINYFVANYRLYHHDMMPDPNEPNITEEESNRRKILKECRGMIFDQNGNLISRRFHKFHNLNERPEYNPEAIDLLHPDARILVKEDGSMIAPYMLDGNLKWGTKMGHDTDIAQLATKFVDKDSKYTAFAVHCCVELGVTPIFEFCSRENRVVIDYPKPKMVLLALRGINSGVYLDWDYTCKIAKEFDIDIVQSIQSPKSGNINEYAAHIKEQEGIEGVIIRLPDGHMVKIKAMYYILLHKTKDQISLEKNVLRAVLEGKLDDILPLVVEPDIKDRLITYNDKVISSIEKHEKYISEFCAKYAHLNQKDFASKALAADYSTLLFSARKKEKSVYDIIKNYMLLNTSSKTKVEHIRSLIDCKWDDVLFDE